MVLSEERGASKNPGTFQALKENISDAISEISVETFKATIQSSPIMFRCYQWPPQI